MNHQCVASVKKMKTKQLGFWDMKLSIWSFLSKLGRKSCSQMFSVRTEVCFITQETKIQKPGHQQPVHQEPRSSVLAVGQVTCPLLVPVLGEQANFTKLLKSLTSLTAGPALVKALPHLLIAFQCLLQSTPAFLFEK